MPLARDLALRYAPPPEALLNEVVNRLPFVSLRMRLYQAFGVQFEDPRQAAIMLHAEVFSPGRLRMGRGSIVGRHCLLDARGGITLGRDVNMSSYVRVMTAKHLVQDPKFTADFAPVVLGDRVWCGLGATVLGGVEIGEGAVVAAGAVVTRNIEPFTIVGGVPAQPIAARTDDLDYAITYRPNWL